MNREHLFIPLYFVTVFYRLRQNIPGSKKKVTFNILDVGKALDLMDFVFIT